MVSLADEVKRIKTKFIKTDYPLGFVESFIGNFQSPMEVQDSFIIPPSLFNEYKPFTLIIIPFYRKKTTTDLKIWSKNYTIAQIEKNRISINWIAKKIKPLFPLKVENINLIDKICHGLWSCKENYVDESNSPTHDSEPAKDLKKHI